MLKLKYIIFFFISLTVSVISSQSITVVKGQILDATNKEPLIYVNVQFENTSIGTTSDIDGKFFISTTERIEILRVSYVGYTTRNIKIKPGQVNDLNILLDEEGVNLDAVEIKVEKYRNKGNPAVELIKNVIQNKDKNRKEALDFYSYHKHEKLEFSLNNVTEKMRQNFIFRKINFIFDNADTNKVNGKIFLPFFLKENLSDIYYRKDPKAKKEHLRAEKITNAGEILNSVGISNMMTQMYQEIDFYDNTIMLLTNGFVSPLSPISPSIYRFYIQDTTVVNHKSLIHVFFAPRTKTDFAFVGHLWIANDSTYAVHKIEAGISKDINLNWVRELQISQEYDWVYEDSGVSNSSGDNKKAKSLMLSKDEIFVDFGISKKDSIRSVLGRKTSSYKNITINQKHQDSVFNFSGTQFRYNDASSKSEAFWSENRNSPLTASEQGIYNMVDSLNNFKPFKRAMTIARLVFEGYTSIGSFDLGPANTFYSFNPVEGFRLRLGGRTNHKFSERFMLEGYGAYGFRDQQLKGYAALRYNIGSGQVLRFPYNRMKLWYINDLKIPGQELQFIQEDNIFLSIKRGVNNKMFFTKTVGIEYLNESQSGFSYSVGLQKTSQRAAGALLFDYDSINERMFKDAVRSAEVKLMLRYAPNEKFYEGATYRTPMLTKYPIIEFRYAAGLDGAEVGDYNYHNIQLKAKKVFFLPPFGYAELTIEGGRIFGQVPYTLLTAHRANQTYAYQLESYNLMNFLEFVSDKFASVNYQHNFQGIFFGRLPILNKLKWREVLSFKGLWGGLDDSNIPDNTNELLRFPVDENGQTLTNTLESKPYMEASVGIGNIFKVLRIDYIRRLSYTELSNVSKWGIRTRVKFEF